VKNAINIKNKKVNKKEIKVSMPTQHTNLLPKPKSKAYAI
jgi:hypothetical protein